MRIVISLFVLFLIMVGFDLYNSSFVLLENNINPFFYQDASAATILGPVDAKDSYLEFNSATAKKTAKTFISHDRQCTSLRQKRGKNI